VIIGGYVIVRADGRPFYGLGGGIQMRTDAAQAARSAKTLSVPDGNTGTLHVRPAELHILEPIPEPNDSWQGSDESEGGDDATAL